MYTVLIIIQILVAAGLIGMILMQQGKGADMGAAFGSGASGTVFGSRGSGSFLSKTTGILAAAFFINSLLLAIPAISQNSNAPASVVEQMVSEEAPAVESMVEEVQTQTDLPDVPAIAPSKAEEATEQ